MKVNQIIYSGMGGHCSVAFSLLEGDVKNIWNKSIIFYGVEEIIPEYIDKCKKYNINYYIVKINSGNHILKWFEIYKYLKKINPDKIILHTNCIIPVFLYSFFFKKKFIYVEHLATKLKQPKDWIISYLSNLFSYKIVVLHKNYLNELKKKIPIFIFRYNKYQIINNGINTELFKPSTKISKNNSWLKIGMASRLTHSKNHDLILEMISKNKLFFKNNKLKFSIVGNGPNYSYLKKRINELAIHEYVSLNGYYNEIEIVNWYKSLKIYAHCTFDEAQSMSIIQAMSLNLPVLVSNIDGIKFNLKIKQCDNFYLFDNNINSFYNELKKIVESIHKKEYQVLSRPIVLRYFNHIKMFNEYNKIINQ